MNSKKLKESSAPFKPLKLVAVQTDNSNAGRRLTITCTLKGDAAVEFERLVEETGLNKSQLSLQMVYHALGKTDDLKDFYRRLAILAE